ncbi:hypothetical protein [Mycolicibacterium sp. XJ1819]
MTTARQSEIRTRLFARVLGPYMVFAAVVAMVRASEMPDLLSEFSANTVWPWVTGALVLLSGLIVVALHPYWRGIAATIVSVIGCLTALKGALLLAIPQTYLSAADSMVDAGRWWMAIEVVVAVAGLYLVYVGWAPTHGRQAAHSESSSVNLQTAA